MIKNLEDNLLSKKSKKHILISGLGGSAFPYLHNALSINYELFYVDANDKLEFIYPDLNFINSPSVLDPQYFSFIRNIIKENSIEVYIPLIDEEIFLAKSEIEGYNDVIVVSPTAEFSKRSLNKYRLMKELSDFGISSVESYLGSDFDWQLKAPVFVKPVTGRGSRGIRTIHDQEQLQAYYLLEDYKPHEVLVQPKLEGVEYTVGVTVNNLNVVLAISSKKVISKKGITQMGVTENVPEIDELALKIVKEFRPCGPINIQLIQETNGSLKIFEINPRFSTTTIMEFEGGIDLVKLYIETFNSNTSRPIKRPKAGVHLYRRWESLFY